MPKSYPIVLIWWVDSEGDSSHEGWTDVPDALEWAKESLLPECCVTIGLLIHKSKEHLSIYSSAHKGEMHSPMKIPRQAVQRIDSLGDLPWPPKLP
jgi:hypothetical protein